MSDGRNREIERKYFVPSLELPDDGVTSKEISQWYLAGPERCSLRVRIKGDRATLALKSRGAAIDRYESEMSIPRDYAEDLVGTQGFRELSVRKIRYSYSHEGRTWLVDQFLDRNEGLVLAELELTAVDLEDDSINAPAGWVEVTDDWSFYNEMLALEPYENWSAEKRAAIVMGD